VITCRSLTLKRIFYLQIEIDYLWTEKSGKIFYIV